jgi:hypothetical protein
MTKDPTRVLRGKLGAAVQQSLHDPRLYTANARTAFLGRFWPDDPTLPPEESERRAQAALRAHMLRLAYASAKARRGRRNGGAS